MLAGVPPPVIRRRRFNIIFLFYSSRQAPRRRIRLRFAPAFCRSEYENILVNVLPPFEFTGDRPLLVEVFRPYKTRCSCLSILSFMIADPSWSSSFSASAKLRWGFDKGGIVADHVAALSLSKSFKLPAGCCVAISNRACFLA